MILTVSRLKSFAEYTLTAGGIPDRATARNQLPAGTKAKFVTPSYYAYASTIGSVAGWDQAYYTLTAASKDVTVLSFEIVAFHNADTDYLLYTKPGDFAGSEFDASAWKLVSSNHLAFSIIPIPRSMGPLEIKVPAGKSQSFLIAHTTGAGNVYVGGGELANDDFTLAVGKNYTRSGGDIFGGGEESGDRAFAGYIRYCLDSCSAPAAPQVLSVSREAGSVKLSWSDPAFHLQSAAALPAQSWTDVAGDSPVLVTPGEKQLFHRLIRR